MVAPTKDSTEGLGLSIQDFTAYFYSKNGFVALTQPERLQRAFDVLASLFVWDSLWTNAHKTVSMACQPCHAPVQMS